MTLIGILAVYRHRNVQPNPSLRQSLRQFKVNLILLAVCMTISIAGLYILVAIPNDGGYPNVPEDVQTAEQVLNYLQQYNRTIRTNTYLLLWCFYGFTVSFLTTLYAFAQAVVRALLARSQL
ncbi:MAG: hypothetical protein AAGF66_05445 [Cyanobacteria bacterium P01_H01_bin.119]